MKVALNDCLKMDSPAAIVLDMNYRPVGTILLHDIVELSEEQLDSYSVDDCALNLTEVFRQSGLPILAIVDENGKFMGTVRERDIIRRLASV